MTERRSCFQRRTETEEIRCGVDLANIDGQSGVRIVDCLCERPRRCKLLCAIYVLWILCAKGLVLYELLGAIAVSGFSGEKDGRKSFVLRIVWLCRRDLEFLSVIAASRMVINRHWTVYMEQFTEFTKFMPIHRNGP